MGRAFGAGPRCDRGERREGRKKDRTGGAAARRMGRRARTARCSHWLGAAWGEWLVEGKELSMRNEVDQKQKRQVAVKGGRGGALPRRPQCPPMGALLSPHCFYLPPPPGVDPLMSPLLQVPARGGDKTGSWAIHFPDLRCHSCLETLRRRSHSCHMAERGKP